MKQATKILSQSKQVRLTDLETEKCQLYANILQYDENEKWTKNLQIRLASRPTDQTVIEEVVKTVLRRVDHPLTQWLHTKQHLVHKKCIYLLELYKQHLSNEELLCLVNGEAERSSRISDHQRSNGLCIGDTESAVSHKTIPHKSDNGSSLKNYLEETVNCTCNICDTCVLMLGLMYEKLNESEIAQDICHRVVEDIVLGPVWQYLISLFRCHNKQSECKIAQAMKGFADATPSDFGLKMFSTDKRFSYNECASKLKGILSITSPVQKLLSLVQAVQKLCELQRTAEDGTALTPILLGADDLIPMLSYILVQAGLPCLLSECQALEQLLDQRYLLGEEGYCLTSCQMAFKYLEAQADRVNS